MQTTVEENQISPSVKMTMFLPWIVCIAASLFFFYEFIQGNMFASIADDIMRDFHVQADKMTYLSSIYYATNVLFLFVAGIVLDRFSAKKTIVIAMLLCIIGTLVLAYAHTYSVALFCRFLTGIGSAFCFLGPIRIASHWFPPKRMAFVTGVVVTIAMTGGMIAQYPLTKLVSYTGWREAVLLIGWLGVFMLGIMVSLIKDAPHSTVKLKQNKHSLGILASAKKAYLNSQILRAALYASLMNMAVAVFGAMMGSLYLMQRLSVCKEDASMVNSMLFLGAIIGGPVMGWISDKVGLRILPMKLALGASFITLLAILYAPVSLQMMTVLFFLLGFFTAAQIISYALAAESSPPVMTAMAVSIISIFTQSGYMIYQNLFSFLLLRHGDMLIINHTPVYSLGDYQTAAIMLPLGLGIAMFAVYRLKETHCRQVTHPLSES
jgi:MFS family permease